MLVVEGREVGPLEVAGTRRARGRGLLGRSGIEGALWLPGVRSVHTLGLGFALDVAWIGPRGDVRRVRRLLPGRVTGWHRAAGLLEAEAGAFATWGLGPGRHVTHVERINDDGVSGSARPSPHA